MANAIISRVDLEANMNNLIVPAGEIWIAIDKEEYATGNGISKYSELEHRALDGTIVPIDDQIPFDPAEDYILDGGDLDA